MESDLNEIKITVRSLITSSAKQLTIKDFVRDYKEAEGKSLPFGVFGFNSVIEFLQNMKDVLTIPPNPTEHSIISPIISEKTVHIKNLIDKQKSSKKKKKGKSSINGRLTNYNNHYVNGNINDTSHFSRTYSKNCHINISHNSLSDYCAPSYRHNISYTNNQSIQQDLLNNSIHPLIPSHNGFDRSYSKQNMSSGCVTLSLQLYIERYIFGQQKKVISLNKFKDLIKSHSDYKFLKLKSMSDAIHKFTFLTINENEVSLKTTDQNCKISNESTPLIYQVPDLSTNSSQTSDVENSKVLDLSEKSQSVEHDFHIRPGSSFLRKNITLNQNKNSDVAVGNLKKNIECVKRQSAMRKMIETQSSNEMQSGCSFFKENGLNNNENYPENAKICIKRENQCFPIEMLYNISKIFQVYRDGLNIENFKILYAELYHTVFDPISNGFSSTLEMLKVLDLLVEVKNNVLYTINVKAYSNLYKQIELNDDTILTTQKKIIDHMSTKFNVQVSLHVQQQLLNNIDGKRKMLLVDAYNPSSFYLKLAHKHVEFDRLMNLMQIFYDKDTTNNLLVQQDQILPGSTYVTSYTTFSTLKQWYRVRVLNKVEFLTANNVTVIHVDYGTMDIIPKTELRFLKNEFCQLPCQAIHCCLTNYNELVTISEEVTEAFKDIIDINPVTVEVDKCYTFNKQYQMLHVSLFHTEPSLININNELTIWHLNV